MSFPTFRCFLPSLFSLALTPSKVTRCTTLPCSLNTTRCNTSFTVKDISNRLFLYSTTSSSWSEKSQRFQKLLFCSLFFLSFIGYLLPRYTFRSVVSEIRRTFQPTLTSLVHSFSAKFINFAPLLEIFVGKNSSCVFIYFVLSSRICPVAYKSSLLYF